MGAGIPRNGRGCGPWLPGPRASAKTVAHTLSGDAHWRGFLARLGKVPVLRTRIVVPCSRESSTSPQSRRVAQIRQRTIELRTQNLLHRARVDGANRRSFESPLGIHQPIADIRKEGPVVEKGRRLEVLDKLAA